VEAVWGGSPMVVVSGEGTWDPEASCAAALFSPTIVKILPQKHVANRFPGWPPLVCLSR
jgi:hypothetical protein